MTNQDRLYDRNFLIAFLSQTCFVCANTLMAHYARWIEFLGGDLRQVGLVMGISATIGLILRPWMAQWINRLGARRMWFAGYAVFSSSSVANVWLDDVGVTMYIVRSGLLLGAAIVFASGLTYISQTAPEHRRTEAIGVFGIGGFLGMLIGPLLGDLFLAERTRESFESLFMTAAVANVMPAIGLLFLRDSHRHGEAGSVRLKEFVAVARRHWPGMILFVDFAFGICMTAPFVFVASFIDDASLQQGRMSIIGLFFLCYAGLGIVIRLWSRRLPDRIGSSRVLLVGMCFMSLGMFSFGLVSEKQPLLIVVPALLAGTGHGLMFHTMTSLTLAPFPVEVRGTGSALALMMLDLGTIAGAPALGMVGEQYGYGMLFGTIGLFCAAAAIAYAASRMRFAAKQSAIEIETAET